MYLDFVKLNNRWFADVPNWEGSLEDLEMVNTDVFNRLAGREKILRTVITTCPNGGGIVLKKLDESGNYVMCTTDGMVLHYIWICEVTKFVFGEYPKKIYMKILDDENSSFW